jgi:hypothetical protein
MPLVALAHHPSIWIFFLKLNDAEIHIPKAGFIPSGTAADLYARFFSECEISVRYAFRGLQQ